MDTKLLQMFQAIEKRLQNIEARVTNMENTGCKVTKFTADQEVPNGGSEPIKGTATGLTWQDTGSQAESVGDGSDDNPKDEASV